MGRLAVVPFLVACGGTETGGGGGPGPPVTAQELGTVCVLAGSCGVGDGINDCFTDVAPGLRPVTMRCVLNAGADCAAVQACFGITFALSSTCTPGTTCEGTTLVQCRDGVRATIACEGPLGTGPDCVIGSGGASCGVATCSSPSRSCDGTVAEQCNTTRGVLQSVDCASYGLSCIEGTCTAPGGGASCTAGTPATCVGTEIEGCSSGITQRTDCAARAVDSSCFTVPTTMEAYCGYGTTCLPVKGAETCSGSTISYCAAGVPTMVDCTSLGFAQCLSRGCFGRLGM